MVNIAPNDGRYSCNCCRTQYETTENDIKNIYIDVTCLALCHNCRVQLYEKLRKDLINDNRNRRK